MRIAVIGAGITGLTTAHFLKHKYPDFSITIYEKKSFPGGMISRKDLEGKKYFFGPKTVVMRKGSPFEKLIEQLHLKDQIPIFQNKIKKRWIFYQNRRICLPTSFFDLLKKPFFRFILGGIQDLVSPRFEKDETVKQFFSRRFGEKAAEILARPLVFGVYGGGLDRLSMESAFPYLKGLEKKYGSILKGFLFGKKNPRSIVTFSNGLYELVEKIIDQNQLSIQYLARDLQMEHQIDRITITVNQTEKKDFDHVFLAVDLPQLSPFIPEIKTAFQFENSASIAEVFMDYPSILIPEGFGCLNAQEENPKILGMIFNQSIYSDQTVSLTVMIKLENETDEQLYQEAIEAVQLWLNIDSAPKNFEIRRYPHAIYWPEMGHKEKKIAFDQMISEKYPHLTIVGASLSGVSVADHIASAHDAIEKFLPIEKPLPCV